MTGQAEHDDLTGISTQFDVPIRKIEEMLPVIVDSTPEGHLDKGSPLGTLRLAHQTEAGFRRRAIGFPGITWNARANDVFPSRGPSTIPRDDVIRGDLLRTR